MPALSDISSILTLLLGACVLVWAADAIVFRPARQRSSSGDAVSSPRIVECARSLLPVILSVLLVRSFVFEPFRIPSASMMPGLLNGDFIFVNKYLYGLRLPLINTKILNTGHPQRGDVVVFRLPSDPSTDYIKRLIGVPGDHVVVRDNRVFINGTEVGQQPHGRFQGVGEFSGADLALEKLGGKEHLIMLAPGRPATDFEGDVPAAHYFFMGDNRNDSQDGRFGVVGFVPERNIVGPATRIGLNWRQLDWHRIWMKIT